MDSLPLLSWQFAIIQVAADKVVDPVSSSFFKSDVIYQTQETVFRQDIQTPRRELKIRHAAEYF